MKLKIIIVLLVVVVLVALLVGFSPGLFSGGGEPGVTDWRTERVVRRDFGSSVLATGIIKPCVGAEVRVGSRVPGIVSSLHVEIGDKVKKGELLAELEPTELRARCNRARAAVENAQAELNYAKINLKRMRAIGRKNFASQDEVDLAERGHDVAVSVLKQRRADLEEAEVQLGYTRIYAPISGVVASVSTQEGETVVNGLQAPEFVVLIDLERLEVRAYVDETDIGRIREGQRATFTVDTYPGVDFSGGVTAIYPKAEMKDNVVNYMTIIEVGPLETGYILRPEMTATVKIAQEVRTGVATISKKALHREKGKYFVYVLKNKDRRKQWVEVGQRKDGYVEITKGLTANDQINLEKKEEEKIW